MEEEKQIDVSKLPQPPAGAEFSLRGVEKLSVPHPYCITPGHVAIAADRFSGMLGTDAIAAAEKQGVRCGIKGCQLAYDKHETVVALLIEVPANDDLNKVAGLHKYLHGNKQVFVAAGIQGFAFPEKK